VLLKASSTASVDERRLRVLGFLSGGSVADKVEVATLFATTIVDPELQAALGLLSVSMEGLTALA